MAEVLQDVMNAVYVALTADTAAGGVATLATGGIYEIQADEDTSLPYVVYTMITANPRGQLTADKVDSEIALDIIGHTNNGLAVLRTIGERAFAVLNRQSLTVSRAGFTGTCTLNCLNRGLPTPEADEYRLAQTYRAQIMS